MGQLQAPGMAGQVADGQVSDLPLRDRPLLRTILTGRPVVRLVALAAFLLALLPGRVFADGIEVTDVKADNYPRVVVRFSARAADGSPLTDLKPGQLRIEENGVEQRNVDFYSLRESSPDLWTVLVMDVSGSMNDEGKLDQAKAAAKQFLSRLRTRDRTSVATFSRDVVLQQQPTGDLSVLNRTIDALKADGPTRMNDGLARGVAEVLRAPAKARKVVVLLSDGEDTDSRTSLADAMRPALEAGLPIYTIGLGPDVKTEILQGIAAETKARYYAAPKPKDLEYVFKLLSGQLSAQYEVWWPSSTVAASGTVVQGRISLQHPQSHLDAAFSYVMPVFLRPRPTPERIGTAPLKPVEMKPLYGWDLPPWWPMIAAGLGAVSALAALYGLYLRVTQGRLQTRLRAYANVAEAPNSRVLRAAQRAESLKPLILYLAKLCHNLMPARVLDDLRVRLVLAGRPSGWHLSQFLATKLALAAGLAIGGWLFVSASELQATSVLAVTGSLGMLGYYLPHPWLGAQIKARQKEIQRKLPDALDLITVGVGAGLSLDGSILEIVHKSDNALSRELATFLSEMQMGRSRREALQALDKRTQVEDIKVLVASLIQAEELGMNIGEALTIQADQMRQRRRQRAEELAHKATIKMMFPMIMLIFPALFIVIMGPAVPSLMATFQSAR